jgi:branched-chain amino acid transport system substrate-binding protein
MTQDFHSHNLFSIAPTENQLANNYVQFLLSLPRSARPKTVAYATSDDLFALPQIDLARTLLEQRGIKTALYEVYPSDDTYPAPLAQKVVNAHADIVLLGTLGPQDCAAFIKTFIQQHYNPKLIIATAGPDQGQAFIQAIGAKNTEGVIVPGGGWYPGADTYQNAQFIKGYINKYGGARNDISFTTVQAYADGQVLEQAINKIHRINNAALIQELHTSTFNTIMGPVEFDNTGQNTLAVSYLDQWQQGQLIPVFPPSGAQAEPEYPKAWWS